MNKGYEILQEEIKERKEKLKKYCELILKNVDNIVLEIGSGHGHFLVKFAEENPDKLCIGIDILQKRIVRSDKKKSRGELENLHFIKVEASEFLEVLPEEVKLSMIFILFPDPWPKKRHFRRRLIQDEFLSTLAERCDTDGILCFRTDHEEYFDWTVDKLKKHPLWQIENEIPWPLEYETVFQSKITKHNSVICLVK